MLRTRGKLKRWHRGVGILAFLSQLLVNEAAKEAEKEGGSGTLVKAIAKGLKKEGEGGEAEVADKVPEPSGDQLESAIADSAVRPEVQTRFGFGRVDQAALEADKVKQLQEFEEFQRTNPLSRGIQQAGKTFQGLTAGRGLPSTPVIPQAQASVLQPQQQAPAQQATLPALPVTAPQTGGQQRPNVPPGILAGLKGGVLNQPSIRGDIPLERTGRQTAFDVGETLGDFLRKNLLKLPTTDPVPTTVPVIDPQTGKVLFQKPKSAVFQPKARTEAEALKIIRENINKQLTGEGVLAGEEQKVGDIVDRGGKKWKIVGFDKDGEPLVEEVK